MTLSMPARNTSAGLRVGCCGFPLSLRRYAEDFAVVEVQQTFYQPPALHTIEKWRGAVPGGFEFTLKAWQLITHEASSPTYRRLREQLSQQQRREAGAVPLASEWRTIRPGPPGAASASRPYYDQVASSTPCSADPFCRSAVLPPSQRKAADLKNRSALPCWGGT